MIVTKTMFNFNNKIEDSIVRSPPDAKKVVVHFEDDDSSPIKFSSFMNEEMPNVIPEAWNTMLSIAMRQSLKLAFAEHNMTFYQSHYLTNPHQDGKNYVRVYLEIQS